MAENEDRRGLKVGEFLKSKATDHMLQEIFLRLPDLYTVVECTHVCKRWRGVISDPNFFHMFQRRLHGSTTPVLFTLLLGRSGNDGSIQLTGTKLIISQNLSASTRVLHNHFVSLPLGRPFLFRLHQNGADYLDFAPQWQVSVVRASCNELLLLEFPSRRLCVCNPMTRRWFELEKPPSLTSHDNLYTYALACDPISGRGYRVVLYKDNGVSVYNSETRKWGKDLPPPPGPAANFRSMDWKMASLDGVVYSPLHDFHKRFLKNICAFDPFDRSGRILLVGLPSEFRSGWMASWSRAQTWVVRGRLRLWQAYWNRRKNEGSFVFRLWELKLHSREWVTLQDLELKSEGDTFTPTSSVFALHPEDDYTFYLRDDRRFLWQYHIGRCESVKINCDISSFTEPFYKVFPLVHPPWPTAVQ